jgi:hypothetical protein
MSPGYLTRGYAGKWVTLVNWASPQLFVDLIKRFQRSSTTEKRDRFKYSKQSLSFAYIMVNGDTVCPQGNSFYIPVSVSMARRTRDLVLSPCLPVNASRIVAPQSSVQAAALTNPSAPQPPRRHAMSLPLWG